MAEGAPSPRFDHLVVLMFENRSFDHLLGYLYAPGERAGFEGVSERTFSNPVPTDLPGSEGEPITVHPARTMATPYPDPGEEYPHVNTQLYGSVDPAANRAADVAAMEAPYNLPSDPVPVPPPMNGFVLDYVNAFRVQTGRLPSHDEAAQIMACFTPAQLPVLSGLARGFACFDRWFCEVPSQTYPNRSFFHAASSTGLVLNDPPGSFARKNGAPTIFERLGAAGRSWKVYIDPAQMVSATALIHARRLYPFFATRFATHLDFYEEAREGRLPDYAFLEPNMFHPHTDMHPHSMTPILAPLERRVPPHDALLGGERLLREVYDAVRTSASPTGSNALNTTLVVTFDEHGGTFDHVPPPEVPAPDPAAPPGQLGFRFDRAGVRVPTVVVSAWVEAGTVVGTPFRHTSVLRTLRDRFDLGPSLTQRDADAPSLLPILSRASPRPASTWPVLRALAPSFLERAATEIEQLAEADTEMQPLERQLLGEALAAEGGADLTTPIPDPRTISHREAHEHFARIGSALFPLIARRGSGL
jgi:phospholipase C